MFCNQCGREIPSDSMFCPSCGNKVESNLAVQNDNVARDNVVTHETMDALGARGDAFQDRIESVDDKSLNDKLFSIYDALVAPLKRIEFLNGQAGLLEGKKLANSMGFRFMRFPLLSAIIFIIIYGVIGTIASYNQWSSTDGSLLFRVVFAPYNWIVSILDSGSMQEMFSDASILTLFALIVVFAILPGIIIVFVASIIGGLISYMRRKSRLPGIIKEYEETEAERLDLIEKVSPYMGFVPPAYRFSAATSYFAESYRNTRVSNLKEAVKAYENHLQMQGLQNGISEICEELHEIKFNQQVNSGLLQQLHSDLSFTNFLLWAK